MMNEANIEIAAPVRVFADPWHKRFGEVIDSAVIDDEDSFGIAELP